MNFSIDPKEIIYADLDETEGVVLNLKTKNYYRLNETAQVIWRLLEEGKPMDAISQCLAESYEVEETTALSDTHELIAQLRYAGIIRTDPGQSPATSVESARAAKEGQRAD